MAEPYREFWWKWFERVPGHESAFKFFKEPIDVSRPRYELMRAYVLVLAGGVLVAAAVLAPLLQGVLLNTGLFALLLGIIPIMRLAQYGIGKLGWLYLVLGFVSWLFERSPLTLANFGRPDWMELVSFAAWALAIASLVAGTLKLAKLALRTPPPVVPEGGPESELSP